MGCQPLAVTPTRFRPDTCPADGDAEPDAVFYAAADEEWITSWSNLAYVGHGGQRVPSYMGS